MIRKKNIIIETINWGIDKTTKKHLRNSNQCLLYYNTNNNNNYNLKSIILNLYESLSLFKISKSEFLSKLFSVEDEIKNDNQVELNILKEYIKVDKFLIIWYEYSHEPILEYKYCFQKLNEQIGDIQFIITIIGPIDSKCYQIAKSFSNLVKYPSIQYQFESVNNKAGVIEIISNFISESTNNNNQVEPKIQSKTEPFEISMENNNNHHQYKFTFFETIKSILNGYKYLIADIKNRYNYSVYLSDWVDGLSSGPRILKTLSTTVFLFFAILLPSIAFGVLNQSNTHGKFNVSKTLVSQGCGGMVFALLSGQPLVILLSTAPLAIFIKITYSISIENNLDFWTLYAMIGIFNGCFLFIYSIFGASKLMKYSSRFIEETFAIFITIAFLYDGIKPVIVSFIDYLYYSDNCLTTNQIPIFTLLLSLCTIWICFKLSNFNEYQFFNQTIRSLISDYALFIGVLMSTCFRWTIFLPLHYQAFPNDNENLLNTNGMATLSTFGYLLAIALGFLLSLLYFVDQNISCSLATSPTHNLKKWSGVHLDLLVVAIINIILSILGLPWIHGALPHSALHVRALATIQPINDNDDDNNDNDGGCGKSNGIKSEIFQSVQETRASGFFSHLLVFICLFLVDSILQKIPQPVLYGVFWFLGVKALIGNQFWNRILLLITDKANYFNNIDHNIKQCPPSTVYKFTLIQILCLLTFCFISFYPNPYLTIFFPLFLTILIPCKNYILPKLFKKDLLNLLDKE